MKTILTATALAMLALAPAAYAADPSAPANKTDGGSLSSGAKESMPATKNQGENEPVGASSGASSGASAGDTGAASSSSDVIPGTKKGQATSDPSGIKK